MLRLLLTNIDGYNEELNETKFDSNCKLRIKLLHKKTGCEMLMELSPLRAFTVLDLKLTG